MTASVCLLVGIVGIFAAVFYDFGGATIASSEPWNDENASWMQPPGTVLGDGLVAPTDVYVIGPAFAGVGEDPGIARGLAVTSESAWLTSQGDIYEIALGFADQLVPSNPDQLCTQEVENSWVVCTFEGSGMTVELRQNVNEPGQPVVGQVLGSLSLPAAFPGAAAAVEGLDMVASSVAGVPDLQIVEGSFLAGPPGFGSATGGFRAVIGVTGDPDAVFDAYAAQDSNNPYVTTDMQIGDLRVREQTSSDAGGVAMEITLNEIDDNAWILVSVIND